MQLLDRLIILVLLFTLPCSVLAQGGAAYQARLKGYVVERGREATNSMQNVYVGRISNGTGSANNSFYGSANGNYYNNQNGALGSLGGISSLLGGFGSGLSGFSETLFQITQILQTIQSAIYALKNITNTLTNLGSNSNSGTNNYNSGNSYHSGTSQNNTTGSYNQNGTVGSGVNAGTAPTATAQKLADNAYALSQNDAAGPNQCAMGVRLTLESLGIASPTGLGSAYMYDNWLSNSSAYEKVAVGNPSQAPLGSIIVFNGGEYGHVAIVSHDNSGNRIYVSDKGRYDYENTRQGFTGYAYVPR